MPELVDLHSHILPAVDDGSRNVQMSLDMLHRQWEDGVRQVVLTPHFYPGREDPQHFLEKRGRAMERLQEACAKETDVPALSLGAEVRYFRGMSECEELRGLTIAGTKYIMVELPMGKWDPAICRELGEIREKQGLTPVVAHVDRYLPIFAPERMVRSLLEQPVMLQANAESFTRVGTARHMLRMLDRGMIHLLGSDCHDLKERVPNLGKAAAVIVGKLGEDALERIGMLSQKVLSAPKIS